MSLSCLRNCKIGDTIVWKSARDLNGIHYKVTSSFEPDKCIMGLSDDGMVGIFYATNEYIKYIIKIIKRKNDISELHR